MAENEGASTGTTENGSGEGEGTTSTGEGTTKTFTQDEVNRFLAAERRKEREKFAGFDDLKSKAQKFDELTAAQQSDLEKAQQKAAELEARATAAEQRAKDNLVRAAVVHAASTLKAVSPEDVYALLDKNAIEVDDNGNVIGVTEAVTALLEAKPFLKATGFTGSGDGGVRSSGGVKFYTREQIAKPEFYREHQADIMLAAKEGRIKDE